MAAELTPIREASSRDAQDARILRRLETAWPWLVGPMLARFTRPLRVRRGALYLGCWATDHLSHLRAALDAAWPQVAERFEKALHLRITRWHIEPCDPPPPAVPAPEQRDPLAAVLDRLRQNRREGWTKVPR